MSHLTELKLFVGVKFYKEVTPNGAGVGRRCCAAMNMAAEHRSPTGSKGRTKKVRSRRSNVLMAKRQVLCDPIGIGWAEDFGFSQRTPALGVFGFHEMAFAGAPVKNFAGGGYLEAFGD
jgi:hypothetical protein